MQVFKKLLVASRYTVVIYGVWNGRFGFCVFGGRRKVVIQVFIQVWFFRLFEFYFLFFVFGFFLYLQKLFRQYILFWLFRVKFSFSMYRAQVIYVKQVGWKVRFRVLMMCFRIISLYLLYFFRVFWDRGLLFQSYFMGMFILSYKGYLIGYLQGFRRLGVQERGLYSLIGL